MKKINRNQPVIKMIRGLEKRVDRVLEDSFKDLEIDVFD